MKNKILMIFLASSLYGQKQCINCVCTNADNTTELLEPQCNTGTHPQRNRTLSKEEAEKLCTHTCQAKKGRAFKKCYTWQQQSCAKNSVK